MKIAIRFPNWIGDAVMATAALTSLRLSFPDASLLGVMKPNLVPLFVDHPDLDEIIPLQGTLKTAIQLRHKNINVGVIFPNSFSAAWLFFWGGISRRVGYASEGRRILLTDAVPYPTDFRNHHNVENYLQLVVAAGGESNVNHLSLPYDMRHGVDLIPRQSDRPLIGLNPGAAYGAAKRWFPERFATIADQLIKNDGVEIAIFGGPQDIVVEEAIVQKMNHSPIRLSGKLSLGDLPSAIAQCDVFVTNDTGPMHVAAAVNVPIVALFGSTNPKWTAPYGSNHTVFYHHWRCSPCYLRECQLKEERYGCLAAITVEEVIASIKSYLIN